VTLQDGLTFVVNNALGASGVVLGAGNTLGGSGTIAGGISGAGQVSPGNSPGILTASSIDSALGLGLKLEFTAAAPAYGSPTASLNDVLRLTGTAPFTSSFSSANVINIFLGVASVSAGSTFEGGIFTDVASDFLASISGATKTYYVLGNGLGTDATLGTQGYYLLSNYDASLSFDLTTVARTADFGAGNVTGQVMFFTAVPEPSAVALAGLGAALAGYAVRKRRRKA